MYLVYKRIIESFDSKVEVKKLDSSDNLYPGFPGVIAYSFKPSEDEVYLILHSRNPMMLSQEFNGFYSDVLGRNFILHTLDFVKILNPKGRFSMDNVMQDLTPSKSVFKIFSTVIQHTLDYYSKNKTDVLVISSKDSEANRGSLYGKLASKFADKGGGVFVGTRELNMMGQSFGQHIILKNSFNQELVQNDLLDSFLEEFEIDKI